jgi:pyruvate dehydrogenase E2 component (dihydrolipoamide acetyltransferase)
MAIKVTMPKLGLTMEEGRIAEWRKEEGEEIRKGEVLYVIETEKVIFEVEATESGILGKIVAKEGDVLPVGGLVAYVLQAGEKVKDIPELPEMAIEKQEGEAREAAMIERAAGVYSGEPARVKISPVARKIAKQHNIDITTVKGTGPGGRIVKEDILRVVEESKMAAFPPVPKKLESAEEKVVPLSPMRKTIASRMTESFQTPHFYSTMEVDAQKLVRLRERLMPLVEKEVGIKLTLTDLLLMMVTRALEDNPSLNCAYVDGAVKLFNQIHIGVATSVEEGLIVPVVRDANKKTVAEICVARTEIIQKARDRKLVPEEITGGTFTITNVGMWGVDFSNPIINPPEAAILSVGTIKDKPVVRNGKIVVRPTMILTLAADHRVLDGSDAAKFLNSFKSYIENPPALVL